MRFFSNQLWKMPLLSVDERKWAWRERNEKKIKVRNNDNQEWSRDEREWGKVDGDWSQAVRRLC